MKTRYYIIAALAFCAVQACQKEESALPKNEVGKHTVTIHASVSGDTKTILSKEGEDYRGLWETGDVIYIYEKVTAVSPDGSDTREDSSGFVKSDPLTTGGATATFTATFGDYYWVDNSDYADYTFTYSYVASTTNP